MNFLRFTFMFCAAVVLSVSAIAQDIQIAVDFDPDPSAGTFSMTYTITGGLPSVDNTELYTITGDFVGDVPAVGGEYTFAIDYIEADVCSITVTDSDGNTASYTYGPVFALKCLLVEMPNELQAVCDGENVVAEPTISNLNEDGPDVVIYVVHDSPNNNIGTIFAQNTTGEFTFADVDGAEMNTEYFLSAISGPDVISEDGTEEPDGIPDVLSPCYAVSNGTPFVFLAPIVINETNTECDDDLGVTTVFYSIEGGLPMWDNSESYILNGDFNMMVTMDDFPLETQPLNDNSGFSFSATDESGCPSSSILSGPFECSKTDISLVEFSGANHGNQNIIQWSTGSESDNAYFTILKSIDAVNFEILTQLDGAGNSIELLNYQIVDPQIDCQNWYYQLMQTDYDGSSTKSDIIYITTAEVCNTITLVNTIVSNELIISIEGSTAAVDYQIFSVAGKLLKSGNANANISVAEFVDGIYFIQFSNNEVHKFTKQ